MKEEYKFGVFLLILFIFSCKSLFYDNNRVEKSNIQTVKLIDSTLYIVDTVSTSGSLFYFSTEIGPLTENNPSYITLFLDSITLTKCPKPDSSLTILDVIEHGGMIYLPPSGLFYLKGIANLNYYYENNELNQHLSIVYNNEKFDSRKYYNDNYKYKGENDVSELIFKHFKENFVIMFIHIGFANEYNSFLWDFNEIPKDGYLKAISPVTTIVGR